MCAPNPMGQILLVTKMSMVFLKFLVRFCLGDVGKGIVCVGETLEDIYTYIISTGLENSQSYSVFFKWVIDCRTKGMNVVQLYSCMHVFAWCLLINAFATAMIQLMALYLTASDCPFVYSIVVKQSLSFLLRQTKPLIYAYI